MRSFLLCSSLVEHLRKGRRRGGDEQYLALQFISGQLVAGLVMIHTLIEKGYTTQLFFS